MSSAQISVQYDSGGVCRFDFHAAAIRPRVEVAPMSRWNASLCHDRPSFQNATHALPPCNSSCCSFIASRKLAMYNLLSQVAARKLPFSVSLPTTELPRFLPKYFYFTEGLGHFPTSNIPSFPVRDGGDFTGKVPLSHTRCVTFVSSEAPHGECDILPARISQRTVPS